MLLGIYTIGKLLKTTSVYSAFDALAGGHVNLLPFLFYVMFVVAAFFVISQKAWKTRLSPDQVCLHVDTSFSSPYQGTQQPVTVFSVLLPCSTILTLLLHSPLLYSVAFDGSVCYSDVDPLHFLDSCVRVLWTAEVRTGALSIVFRLCFAISDSSDPVCLVSVVRTFMAIDYSEVTIVIILETFIQRRTLNRVKIGSFAAIGLAYFLVFISSGFVTISDENETHHWNHVEPPHLVAASCLVLCLLLGVVRKRIAHRLTSSEPLRRNHKMLTAYSTSIMALILLPGLLFSSSISPFAVIESWSDMHLYFILLEVGGLFLVLDFFMEANVRRRVASSILAKVGLITQFIVCLVYEVLAGWLGSWSILTFLAFALLAGGQHFLLTTAGSIGHSEDASSPLGHDYLLPMGGHGESPTSSSSHRSSSDGAASSLKSFFSSFFELLNQQSDSHGYPEHHHRHQHEHDATDAEGYGGGLSRPTLIHRLLLSATQIMREIWDSNTSRKIFLFMLVNFAFMFVELAYGWWTNSLGLITDAFHMLFDCTALGIGLYAEVVSRWPRSKNFTFGFGRVEVLAGYLNGVFLCFISFSIFAHSIIRMWSPPAVTTDRLLLVSSLGLVVNLIGIFAFHEFDVLELLGLKKASPHSPDHQHHDHDHEHDHSHHGHSHSHGHGGHECNHHSDNLTGIFLHILADALGSVSVIISSILIWQFGWNIVDPICSLLISVLIFASVVPLLKSSVKVLMQTSSSNFEEALPGLLQQIYATPGVVACTSRHFWALTPAEVVGSIQLQVSPQQDKHEIVGRIKHACKSNGVTDLTVQLETDPTPSRFR